MAIVLDTSALIELEKALAAAGPQFLDDEEGLVIPAIVWAEALIGARLADSPERAARRRGHLEAVRMHTEIQAFTPQIAEHYADIYAELSRQGSPIPQNDMSVAATARWMDCPVLVAPPGA